MRLRSGAPSSFGGWAGYLDCDDGGMSNPWAEHQYAAKHSQDDLASWAPSLRYFRYVRAFGGMNSDGDALLVAIGIDSRDDAPQVLGQLGIEIQLLPPDVSQPLPGRRYSGDEMSAFASVCDAYPDLAQPGWTTVAGEPVFAWIKGDRIELACHDDDNNYEVTERTLQRASRLEPLIASLADRIVDPPEEHQRCFCPRFYPDVPW